MTFLEIEEKAEVLRDNTDRLLEDRREQTNAWFQRLMRQMVTFFILGAITYIFGLWYTQNLISTPRPATVHLQVVSATSNPLLCPGDTFQYSFSRDVDEYMTGRVVIVVRNLDTGRQEMSDGFDVIYSSGETKLSTGWIVPAQLPPLGSLPLRPWVAGQYERIFAVASYETGRKIEPVGIRFRISPDCAGVKK